MSESLRLLGYWITYLSTSFTGGRPVPAVSIGPTYLFNGLVVAATIIVPLFALTGLSVVRRWRYAPFFGICAVLMLLVMTAGFPDGKPLERTLTAIYYNVTSLQFLRTTYKAAPMLALALACLAGATAGRLAAEVRRRRPHASPTANAAIVVVPMAVVFVFFVLPVFTGKVIDPRLTYKVPGYWKEAIRTADATTPPDRRVLVAPGQLYASYIWGTTTDAIVLGLSKRPYLARSAVRYAPPAASQLQARVDETLQQGRLVPGQLTPLLGMMSVGTVLVPADGDRRQSGEAGQLEVARGLGSAYAPGRAFGAFGPRATFGPEPGRGGGSVTIPAIRLYRVWPIPPGIVRAHPRTNGTVVDGDADGIIQLAAHRALDPTTALFYAGDLDRQAVARQVRDGSQLVFTDTNRRQVLLGTAVNANVGPVVGADDPLPQELPAYDLFPARGAAAQTVATYSGLRYLRAPASVAFALLPQYRAAALFDGRLDRPWIPATQVQGQRYVDLALSRPHPVDAIRVYPHVDVLGRTDRLAVSVNGGKERRFTLTRGWNSLPIDARPLRTLRLRIVGVRGSVFVGNGGLDEVQIPGVAVRESLRLPTDLATLARGLDLSRTPVRVLLSRVSADFPGRAGSNGEPAQLQSNLNMVDSERELHRTITLPVARAFGLDGWADVDPDAPDPALDTLAGLAAGWRYASSGRFEGIPLNRASSAFDGDRRTAWIGDRGDRRTTPWIEWRTPSPASVRRLRLFEGLAQYTFPALVRVQAPGAPPQTVAVGRDGTVRLRRTVRATRVRLTVLRTRNPTRFSGLANGVAVAEIRVPGVDFAAPRRSGTFATSCGAVSATTARAGVDALVSGSVRALDHAQPLRLRPCGARRSLPLAVGANAVTIGSRGVMLAEHVELSAPGPAPAQPPPEPRTVAVSAATGASGSHVSARVNWRGPSWLVLGQSYSSGWSATCDGRDLGAARRIDGYANGWPLQRSCTRAEFRFEPQRPADLAYWLSGMVIAIMLLVLLITRLAGARWRWSARFAPVLTAPSARWTSMVSDPVVRLGWIVSVTGALLLGAVAGYVFAWRVGAALALAAVVLARVGFNVRRLSVITGVLLSLVLLLYLTYPAPHFDAVYFPYADHFMAGHQLAVAAVAAFAASCVLLMRGHRRRDGEVGEGPSGPSSPEELV